MIKTNLPVILLKGIILLPNNDIRLEFTNDESKNIIDVSAYPDMQEVMIVSDILITDYSSSMWDYSFLKRPGFLFIPDLESYLNERDFYTPIETWPFPFAKNNKDLQSLILNFDENTNLAKIQSHLDSLGSYEIGTASKQIAQLLEL